MNIQTLLKWWADSIVASYVRGLILVIVSNAVTEWAKIGNINFQNWQTWVIAALLAGMPTLSRIFNPADKLGNRLMGR